MYLEESRMQKAKILLERRLQLKMEEHPCPHDTKGDKGQDVQ